MGRGERRFERGVTGDGGGIGRLGRIRDRRRDAVDAGVDGAVRDVELLGLSPEDEACNDLAARPTRHRKLAANLLAALASHASLRRGGCHCRRRERLTVCLRVLADPFGHCRRRLGEKNEVRRREIGMLLSDSRPSELAGEGRGVTRARIPRRVLMASMKGVGGLRGVKYR